MATAMTGNLPKAASSTDKVIRAVTLLNIIPGLAFLIPAGVTRRQLWPLIGIVPLSLSACLGLLVLSIGPRPRLSLMVVFFDLVLAGFALGIYIWGWAEQWRSGMIGGHAAFDLLIVFMIHAFFVLRTILYHRVGILKFLGIFRGGNGCDRCPHCLNEARARRPSVNAVGGKESYHRVPGREDEYDENADGASVYRDPRPSTDDENARLV